VVAGLLLLVLTMIMGNDMTSWMTARQGLGGNLPFVNFAGPKMWATLAIGSGTGSGYWWDFMGTRTKFLTFNLLAAWLVSMPLRDRGGRWLRRWVRWLPTICVGAGVAILNAFDRTYPDGDLRGHRGSELFAIVTVFMEMPATLILYALLARIARELARPGLAKQFRALSVAIIGLVGASLALFVFSRWFFDVRGTMRVIVLSAMYGAASIGIAAWATSAVLSLAGAVWLSELPAPPTGARTAGEALYLAVNDSRAGAKENHLADEVVPEGFAFNAD
jgi:uncharacterized membrane protein YeaQ/YmgE (transglycosylase-associated protein family)